MKKAMQLRVAAIAAGLALAGSAAQATVDGSITTSISNFGADGTTYATNIMLACFSIWAVRKLARKMGWF
jgi:hypothetical protein